ncbi:hypothetical protein, partial [Stenotrophomonas maltophilia]|uniref:hypothetical protein n=1 Tax=Stenotrophomonas maltophilia TaxID=40324 RepID=UPI0030170A5C
PKWTPLSSSWRMVTTAMVVLLGVSAPNGARLRLSAGRDATDSWCPRDPPLPHAHLTKNREGSAR